MHHFWSQTNDQAFPPILSLIVIFLMLCLVLASPAFGQQTLGGLTGVVTDTQGGILSGAAVTLVGEQTGLKRSQISGSNGFYDFANLPIGTYTLSFSKEGFETQKMQAVQVQSDRTGYIERAVEGGRGEYRGECGSRAADERGGYDEWVCARQDANRIDSAADGEPLPAGDSVAWV